MDRAVVLLSGGIDSTVCATLAVGEYGNDNVMGLSFKYGQKHDRELQAAAKVASELGIRRHKFLDVTPVFEESVTHLLRDRGDIPSVSYEELRKSHGPSPMYVPFRNGVFLSMAVSFALQRDAEFIYYGAHAEDSYNWAYPDCTPEFNGSIASAAYIGTYHKVRLVTPLQWMTKSEIVGLGIRIDAPLKYTYSCYRGSLLHCGTCATCVSRIEAFKKQQAVDPVEYMIDIVWPYDDHYNLTI